MASPGATPSIAGSSAAAAAAPRREILEISSDSDTDTDSSIVESASPNPFARQCEWRNAEYNDQECSRFFDCPSHTVERALSDDEAEPHEANPHGEDQEHGQENHSEAGAEASPPPRLSSTLSPHREVVDADAHEPLVEAPSGAVIDLTASPAPEDRDGVMNPSPVDNDVIMGGTSEAGDGGAEVEEVVPDAQRPAINSGGESSATRVPLPSHEVIDLTGDETPPRPSFVRHTSAGSSSIPQRHRPSLTRPPGQRPPLERAAHPSEVSLPRWQPDAEATLCPICRTQFSFFVRKHHCRKCGRVVCNACSPHRITIPYQYIVQPPELPRLSSQRYPPSYVGGDGSYGDFSNIGGGERVRLCNPCVPDPNITPPQPQQSPNPTSPRNHSRSQSNVSVGFGGGGPPPGFSSMFASGVSQGQDPLGRHRSVTHSGPGFGTMASARAMHASVYNSGHGRILAGTPPSYFPATAAYPGAAARGFQSMLDIEASSSSGRERALPPPPPPPQLDEEDECPVCHRELPSRTLPNFEAVRETHITSCIMAHSAYVPGGTPTQGDDATPGAAPPFTMRLSGIFPYIATEKDCVDSAECTICLEEFEEGVEMARLECLCRFHLHCIKRWFKNHQGRCPVHQHDSFGY